MAEDILTLENRVHLEFSVTNAELQQAINDVADRVERYNDWELKGPLTEHLLFLLAVQRARSGFGTLANEVIPNGGSVESEPATAPTQGSGSDGERSPG